MRKIHIVFVLFVISAVVGSVFVFPFFINSEKENGENEAAVSLYDHKEVQLPDTDDPFMLGQYYFNHDNNSDGSYDLVLARKYFTEVLQQDPKGNSLIWYQLGRIDFLEGKFDTALYKFDKQIEYFDDEIPNVYYMIGLTYGYKARQTESEEDWKRGAEGFLKFLQYYPDSPWARTDLTWIYFAEGKFEEMLPILVEGLKENPHHPWLLNMYGLALMNTGDKGGAREHFLMAREEAAKLTADDWGKAYPGNNPAIWPEGLAEFRSVIEKNVALVE